MGFDTVILRSKNIYAFYEPKNDFFNGTMSVTNDGIMEDSVQSKTDLRKGSIEYEKK